MQGPFAASCASECDKSLMEILEKNKSQLHNEHLNTSIQVMRKSFKKERAKFFQNVKKRNFS